MLTLLSLFTLGAMAQDATAEVPDVDAQLYQLPLDSQRTLWTETPKVGPTGYLNAHLMVNYMNGAMGYYEEEAGYQQSALNDALLLDVATSLHLAERVRFGVHVPVYALATSDFSSTGRQGIGDAGLSAKVRITNGFAIDARFTLPTATVRSAPLGARGLTMSPVVILEHDYGRGSFGANVGYRIAPKVETAELTANDQVFARLGFGHELTDGFGLSLDLNGQFDTTGLKSPGSIPIEALAGGWGRIGGLLFRAGVGTGLTNGIGAPLIRGLGIVSWSPRFDKDTDADGLVDRDDDCPKDPEDFDNFDDLDGCPDLDNDLDGIVDVADDCPNEPEDVDTWKDEDGCPDPLTHVVLHAVDESNEILADASLLLRGADLSVDGESDLIVELEPGNYRLEASAPDHEDGALTFDVLDGRPLKIDKVLAHHTGTMHLTVVDTADRPILSATWARVPEEPESIEGSEATVLVHTGEFSITVEAPDFRPTTLPVVVEKDAVTEVIAVLHPSRAAIQQHQIAIMDRVHFETDSAILKSQSYAILDDVAKVLREHPELEQVQIGGHTDYRGTEAYNQLLSEERAASVLAYLVSKGIPADRLETKGYGMSQPVQSGMDSESLRENRRVEFVILEKSGDAPPKAEDTKSSKGVPVPSTKEVAPSKEVPAPPSKEVTPVGK